VAGPLRSARLQKGEEEEGSSVSTRQCVSSIDNLTRHTRHTRLRVAAAGLTRRDLNPKHSLGRTAAACVCMRILRAIAAAERGSKDVQGAVRLRAGGRVVQCEGASGVLFDRRVCSRCLLDRRFGRDD